LIFNSIGVQSQSHTPSPLVTSQLASTFVEIGARAPSSQDAIG